MTVGNPVFDTIGARLVGDQAGATITVSFDGTTQSATLTCGQMYRMVSDQQCHYTGLAATATTGDAMLPANAIDYYTPDSDKKIAVIKASDAGTMWLTPVKRYGE